MTRTAVPSVFATKDKEYRKRFDVASRLARRVHIDVMDGKFVSSKSPSLELLYGLGREKEIDVHLMVKRPEEYLEEMKRINARRIYMHIESEKTNELLKTMQMFKSAGFIVGAAINPETPADSLIPFVFHISGCLVMSVHPGKEGQNFIVGTYNKLRDISKHMQGKEIAVDGGVHPDTAVNLRSYNVDVIVCGSTVFASPNPEEAFEHMKQVFSQ